MTIVNVSGPYEKIIEKVIKKGYAGNKTEVVRQALIAYDRQLGIEDEQEEEVRLVKKKVDEAMARIKSGKSKTYTLEEIKKEFDLP